MKHLVYVLLFIAFLAVSSQKTCLNLRSTDSLEPYAKLEGAWLAVKTSEPFYAFNDKQCLSVNFTMFDSSLGTGIRVVYQDLVNKKKNLWTEFARPWPKELSSLKSFNPFTNRFTNLYVAHVDNNLAVLYKCHQSNAAETNEEAWILSRTSNVNPLLEEYLEVQLKKLGFQQPLTSFQRYQCSSKKRRVRYMGWQVKTKWAEGAQDAPLQKCIEMANGLFEIQMCMDVYKGQPVKPQDDEKPFRGGPW